MAFHRCEICREDAIPVAKDVTVAIEEMESGGVAGWYGTLKGAGLGDLVAGERYRITLDDGRTGEFLVRRNTYAGETSRAVAIHGTGPLR
ncbi:MAG: hypothetical protein ACE5PT_03965 [Gemmatimonadales bacterium]